MRFSNLPIAIKLYSSFGLVVTVLVLVGVHFYSFFTSVTEANRWNIHTWQVIDETLGLTASLINIAAPPAEARLRTPFDASRRFLELICA